MIRQSDNEPTVFEIDLNCDVGEGAENEAELFPLISSCNIACGGHAGDASSMQRVVRLAQKWNVKIGAHPSYPDKENFGRASLILPPDVLIQSIHEQISNLVLALEKEKTPLHHIKAHGALYNEIAKNEDLAATYLEAIESYKKDVLLYIPYASVIEKLALTEGFSISYEAFGDRNYNTNLSLVDRTYPQALKVEPEHVLKHIVQMAKNQQVRCLSGENVKILADTFCIHSDTPSANEIVMYLSKELPNHNIQLRK